MRRHAREAIWASYVPQAVVLDARMQQTERAELDGRKSQEWAQYASPVPLACVQQQEGSNVSARQTDDFPRLVPTRTFAPDFATSAAHFAPANSPRTIDRHPLVTDTVQLKL